MSNTQNDPTKASAAQPKNPSAPDGNSKLPDFLPDFPGDTSGPGPSSGPLPK